MACMQEFTLGPYPSCSGGLYPLTENTCGNCDQPSRDYSLQNNTVNTMTSIASSSAKMMSSPSRRGDDHVLPKRARSPRGVTANIGTPDTCTNLHHFDISLNGSVEVEMMTSALAVQLERHPLFARGGSDVSLRCDSVVSLRCDSVADIATDAASASQFSPAGSHRKTPSLTSFPSHIPFPQLDDEQEEEEKRRAALMQANRVTRQTHQVMQDLERLDAGFDEQECLASAAWAAIASVLSAMRQHKANARVQKYSCGVLQQLACQSNTNRALLLEGGAISDVISTMRLHLSTASIQESGCVVLTCLANGASGSEQIAEQNGVQAILDAMQLHGNNVAIQTHCSHALLCLACSNTDRNCQIAELGGMDIIMSAISQHPDNTKVREYGSAALWSLAYMNTKNKDAIEDAGGTNALDDILNYNDNEPHSPSSEDRCMQLLAKQEDIAESNEIENIAFRSKRGGGIDEIMSAFVRPFQ